MRRNFTEKIRQEFGESELQIYLDLTYNVRVSYMAHIKVREKTNREYYSVSEYLRLKEKKAFFNKKGASKYVKLRTESFKQEIGDKEYAIYQGFDKKLRAYYCCIKWKSKKHNLPILMPSEFLDKFQKKEKLLPTLHNNRYLNSKNEVIYDSITKTFNITRDEIIRIESKFVKLMRKTFNKDDVRMYLSALDNLSLKKHHMLGA